MPISLAQRAPQAPRRAPRAARRAAVAGEAPPSSSQPAGRSVVVLPGLGNNSGDYDALGAKLRASGLHVSVAGVSRLDWARNAAGLRDPAYWAGTLKPRPTVDWYLEAVRRAVDEAQASTSNAPITLLAHSAGGWLGRLFLLEFGTAGVDRFVSLGSPHLPPPAGVIDQTRGILTFIDGACPGCHHAELQYVTVAGKFIEGAPLAGPGTWKQRFVGAAYKQVCGEAAVWGDGIVPVMSAHLEGALNLTLEGAYHSPLGSVDEASSRAAVPGAEDDGAEPAEPPTTLDRLWYGSSGLYEQWAEYLQPPAGRP